MKFKKYFNNLLCDEIRCSDIYKAIDQTADYVEMDIALCVSQQFSGCV